MSPTPLIHQSRGYRWRIYNERATPQRSFTLADFERLSGLSSTAIAAGIKQATVKGLLETSHSGQVKATEKGRLFLDDLVALFI